MPRDGSMHVTECVTCQVLYNKQSLAALVEALEDAAALGEGEGPLALGIKKRLDDARGWETRAAAFFATPDRCDMADLEVILFLLLHMLSSKEEVPKAAS